MMRFAAASIFILGLVSMLPAQSGRRVQQPLPSPTPSGQDAASEYSESMPNKRFRRSLPPVRETSAIKSISSPPVPADGPRTEPAIAADSGEVLKVDTNLITIPVSVFDRNGLYIPNLRQGDFRVFEDGKEQEIAYFGTSDKPFTVVLLIDTSPSTEYRIEEIQRAAIAFVDQLKSVDKVMVVEFDGNIHVLTEVTGDRKKIYKAIGKADFGYGTSLYEAVDFSLKKRLSKIEGRKAIVLFTDGVDTTSRKTDYDSTLDLAEESDSLVFPIYYNTFSENNGGLISRLPFPGESNAPGTTAADYAVGKRYLEELAAYTGGRVFRPEATPGGLTAAFEGIAEELRRQYNIGYIPVETGKPGHRKQIRVRVNRPNLVLRARDSYIVGTDTK